MENTGPRAVATGSTERSSAGAGSDRFRKDPPGPRVLIDGREAGPEAIAALAWLAGDALVEVTAWCRPTYPQKAVDARVCGTVMVEFSLSARARIKGIALGDGPDRLRRAAEAAARTWRFAFKAGREAKRVVVCVPFTFVEDHGAYYASVGLIEDRNLNPNLPFPDPASLKARGPSHDADEGTAGLGRRPKGLELVPPVSPVPAVEVRFTNIARPRYSEVARRNKTAGSVLLAVCFGANARVTWAYVLDGLPDGLNAMAVEAVRECTFEPARNERGEPMDVWKTMRVDFSIR